MDTIETIDTKVNFKEWLGDEWDEFVEQVFKPDFQEISMERILDGSKFSAILLVATFCKVRHRSNMLYHAGLILDTLRGRNELAHRLIEKIVELLRSPMVIDAISALSERINTNGDELFNLEVSYPEAVVHAVKHEVIITLEDFLMFAFVEGMKLPESSNVEQS